MIIAITEHYASDYSAFMAFVDLIPVFLFFFAGVILLKDLYNKLSKTNYALLSSGVIMVLVAGLLKAVWKILAALNICDFIVFNLMMMPLQAIGFFLASISLFGLMKKERLMKLKSVCLFPILVLLAEEPLEFYHTSVPFLALQTIGSSILLILLMIVSCKMNSKLALVLLIISFITMWGMGGLAACQNSISTTLWNWLEEIDNSISQGTLLAAVIILDRCGLGNEKIYVK